MSSLAVNFLGIPMASPVIGASGTVGFGLELAQFIDMKKVGAISGKGLAPTPWTGNNGTRIAETTSGMLNCIGLENPGAPYFLEHYLPEVKKLGCPYIANMVGKSVEEYAECAKLLSVPGISALEVNISCPNVKVGGAAFGTDPEQAASVTRAVKDATDLPVIVKLSPNVTDVVTMPKPSKRPALMPSLSSIPSSASLSIPEREPRSSATSPAASPARRSSLWLFVWSGRSRKPSASPSADWAAS